MGFSLIALTSFSLAVLTILRKSDLYSFELFTSKGVNGDSSAGGSESNNSGKKNIKRNKSQAANKVTKVPSDSGTLPRQAANNKVTSTGSASTVNFKNNKKKSQPLYIDTSSSYTSSYNIGKEKDDGLLEADTKLASIIFYTLIRDFFIYTGFFYILLLTYKYNSYNNSFLNELLALAIVVAVCIRPILLEISSASVAKNKLLYSVFDTAVIIFIFIVFYYNFTTFININSISSINGNNATTSSNYSYGSKFLFTSVITYNVTKLDASFIGFLKTFKIKLDFSKSDLQFSSPYKSLESVVYLMDLSLNNVLLSGNLYFFIFFYLLSWLIVYILRLNKKNKIKNFIIFLIRFIRNNKPKFLLATIVTISTSNLLLAALLKHKFALSTFGYCPHYFCLLVLIELTLRVTIISFVCFKGLFNSYKRKSLFLTFILFSVLYLLTINVIITVFLIIQSLWVFLICYLM